MKKIQLLTLIILTLNGIIYSQCPAYLTLNTQTQIDNFIIEYPDCTEIYGQVYISGENITNLNGLSNLISIGQELLIEDNNNLIDISGLSNLNHIGGVFTIKNNDVLASLIGLSNLITINGFYIDISDNDVLTDMSGLENLTIVNQLFIENNAGLTILSGFDNLSNIIEFLHIKSNGSLTTISGFENLINIEGEISISNNQNLVDLSGFNNLNYVEGSLFITQNEVLTNMNGFYNIESIGNYLNIYHNTNLIELTGLENLVSVGGSLTLGENYLLQNLNGLSGLNTIGNALVIYKCNTLLSLSGLDALISIGGKLDISNNNDLESLAGIENILEESISELKIVFNPQLSICEVKSVCDYLFSPNGDIEIHNNSNGCNNSDEVEYSCTVYQNEDKVYSDFSYYPNPAKNELFLTNNTFDKIINLSIYNQLGQSVLIQNKISNRVDVSNLETGIYTIVVTSYSNIFRDKLIIK